MAQIGFLDLSDRYASLDAKRHPLAEIDAMVPWEEFRPTLEQVWRKPDAQRNPRAKRKPMDAIFRAIAQTAIAGAAHRAGRPRSCRNGCLAAPLTPDRTTQEGYQARDSPARHRRT